MLPFSSSVLEEGQLPPPFTIDDFSNKEKLASRADKIYDTLPNLVVQLSSDKGPIVVKWFGWRHPMHYPLSPTFPSRAFASWIVAHTLQHAKTRTPKPLYVYTRRYRGLIKENFFITEAIHPHTRLRKVLISETPETFLNASIKDLALSIARMHKQGIFHRDLTTGNFLVNEMGEVFIVDLNRTQLLRKLSTHQRLIDLAKLFFNTEKPELTNRLTHLFFTTYEEESKLGLNLFEQYSEYRNRLLRRRRIKKGLRRFTGRK